MRTKVPLLALLAMVLCLVLNSAVARSDGLHPPHSLYDRLGQLGWRELTFANAGRVFGCRAENGCVIEESSIHSFLRWKSRRIGLGSFEASDYDNFAKTLLADSSFENFSIFLETRFPQDKYGFLNRIYYGYRWVVNKISFNSPPRISINRNCVGDIACMGCIGWACSGLVSLYPSYLDSINGTKSNQVYGYLKSLYRRYRVVNSRGGNEVPKNIYIEQYMTLKRGFLVRFDCFYDQTGKWFIEKVFIAACLCNAIGYMGYVDVAKHLLVENDKVSINPEFLRAVTE